MSTVRQLLKAIKQEDVFTTTPTSTVYEALDLMIQKNVGALPVVENEKLVGIVSERDLCRRVLYKGLPAKETKIRDAMTPNPHYVSLFKTLEDCEADMAELNARHLPVLDDDKKLVGVVSMKDILVVTRRDQELLAMQYESYIGGRS